MLLKQNVEEREIEGEAFVMSLASTNKKEIIITSHPIHYF
jgi:hypothetical protein